MIGRLLKHPQLGTCKVTKIIGPNEAEVSFPTLGINGMRVRLAALIDPETGKAPGSAVSPKAGLPTIMRGGPLLTIDAEMLRARLAILALRLGQCPEDYIDQLTVGATEVKEACEWAIARSHEGKPAIVIFESPFGKGKTHALNLFSSIARRQSRAVGSVVLDGVGISLSEPMSLLSSLAESIRFPEGGGTEPFTERLCDLIQQHKVQALRSRGAYFLADCLEQVPREIADQPDAWEIVVDYLSCVLPASQAKQMLGGYRVNGLPPSLPAIVAHRVDERAERCLKMLREWAQACTLVGASRGLVVILDEADVDYGNTGFGTKSVECRTRLFRAMKQMAEASWRTYLSIGIGITPGQDNHWGEEAVDEMMEHLGGECTRHVQLKDLSKRDFTELGKNVASLYERAFGEVVLTPVEAVDHADKLRGRMASRINDSCLPRRFIREFIEHLDVVALK